MTRIARTAFAVALVVLATAAAPGGDRLAVFHRGEWRTWWRADAPRTQWTAPDRILSAAVKWERLQTGLETAELRIAARAPALRIRLILVRIDPPRFDWALVEQRDADGKPAWEARAAPPEAAFAFNAGQFASGRPWGWIVRGGQETQRPRFGPLSMALVIDSARNAHLVEFQNLETARSSAQVVMAFQSYPMLLEGNGMVPEALRTEGKGVDLRHRDSRLAIGELRDGRILLALTRYDVGGGLLRPVPIGPNTPEMTAIMGALGCSKAVMLDGGISSQLLVRDKAGGARSWDAYRWVPLGLVATPAYNGY